MKKVLIIVAVVVVVIVIAFIVIFATKGKQMMELAIDRGFGAMENLMLTNRPASVSEDSIKTVIDSAIEKVRSGEIDPREMQAIMMKFNGLMDDKQLDSLEVKTMLEELSNL
jgi:hypothetical protein